MRSKGRVRSNAFPGLKTETWVTQFCAEEGKAGR